MLSRFSLMLCVMDENAFFFSSKNDNLLFFVVAVVFCFVFLRKAWM